MDFNKEKKIADEIIKLIENSINQSEIFKSKIENCHIEIEDVAGIKKFFKIKILTENKVGQRGNLVYGLDFKYEGSIKDKDRFVSGVYEMIEYTKNMGVSSKDISVYMYLSKGGKLISKGIIDQWTKKLYWYNKKYAGRGER